VSYRPALTGRAFGQFSDLLRDRPDAYVALAARLTRLVDEPWDAWQVQLGGGEPEFRETQFGEHGPAGPEGRGRERGIGGLPRSLALIDADAGQTDGDRYPPPVPGPLP
jgi:hypothetical protein